MTTTRPHPRLKHVYLVGDKRAFVRAERGRWILTHRCVVISCPHPDCLAPPGRPCNGPGRPYTTTTHVQRRNAGGWK